ncbi:MAG TPA: methyl-accepting chemotaxis protein [Clostridiales bacterium]|nr:methyl-accepting chemotaxis protein [Clostridiales bacterium]
MSEDILMTLTEAMPYFIRLISQDLNVGIYDREKCIACFYTNNFDLGVKEGTKIPENGATAVAIRNRQKVVKEVPREVFGIPYIATSIPVFNSEGEVVGAITAAESVDRREKLVGMASSLSSTMEEITATIEEISSATEQVAGLAVNIENLANENLDNVNQTDDVLNFIYSIAKQTKMLGLNATIEAARAGTAGATFRVVASEVSKLAESSGESTKKINEILEAIKNGNQNMCEESKKIAGILQNLALSIQEISSSIINLSSMAEELLALSKDIQALKE